MNHAEITGNMEAFLDDTLSPFETYRFLRHLKGCPVCREELEVRLLVRLAGGTLKTEAAFDLRKSMEEILGKRRKKARILFIFGGLAAALCVFSAAVLIIFL